ncbi:hypothetical protein R6Q57_012544 [Mikania cordata]
MDSKVIENITKRFHFNGSGSLLYWQRIQDGNKWCLTLEGQPFIPTAEKLKQYRKFCLEYSKKLAGVIELAKCHPGEDYAKDYLLLSNLLKGENLATKALIVKVTYKKDTIKFPLLSIGIEYLWENVKSGRFGSSR